MLFSACGSSCINAANAPKCANSLDPACVCGLSSVSLFKCFFDSCDEAGAANSVNGFAVNCGLLVSLVTCDLETNR
jgi:hypothetical protein